MLSKTSLLTEDSKKEIKALLDSSKYYVNANGKMTYRSSNDVIDLVLVSMTS